MSAKTATRRSSKYRTYSDCRDIAALPIAKRPFLSIGRKGAKKQVRNYSLSDSKVASLKLEVEGGSVLPNPFNISWRYYFVETMKELGLNRNHSLKRVMERFKELTSVAETKNSEGKTFWQVYKNKEARNANGRRWDGRFEQNIEVLQRVERPDRENLTPAGNPLLEVGTKVLGTAGVVVDVLIGSTGETMIRLNTDSAMPVNETKRKAKVEAVADTAAVVADAVVEAAPEVPAEVAPVAEVAPATEAPIQTEVAVSDSTTEVTA